MSEGAPVYCDITELVLNPIRTGIQRVVREVLKNWPGKRPLVPSIFDREQGTLVELPKAALYYLLDSDAATRSASPEELRRRIVDVLRSAMTKPVPIARTVFIPEVFFDESRARHYIWRMSHRVEDVFILFYDFIPWLHPDIIGVHRSAHLMWYLRLSQTVKKCAFISDATRRDWAQRIVRDPLRPGAVLPLGADGLPLPSQSFSPINRTFVAVGSIDGRKNQDLLLDAFELLWDRNIDVNLTFVGRVFDTEGQMAKRLRQASANPRFRHVDSATDEELGAIMSQARATLYVSQKEGFGLPPVESLNAGIPCIVNAATPSVEALNGSGLRLVRALTPQAVADEVEVLADDDQARQHWQDAASLSLPTWRDFGHAAAAWIGEAA